MKNSAGVVIIQDNKILLGHPTGAAWIGTYSIPKGEIDEHETPLEAAIRETKEEFGLNVYNCNIGRDDIINYVKDDVVYKKVFYYIIYAQPDWFKIDQDKLQREEIDWAGFLTKEEASERIFWRLKDVLKYLK